MNRLQTELQRLYLPSASCEDPHSPVPNGPQAASGLADADGRVRALVVELRLPVGWDAVTAFWQGVQTELDLPPPAIAVNGIDGYQVWFSLQQPVAVAQAMEFLETLRLRYLGSITSRQLTLMPALDTAQGQLRLPGLLPAVQAETGHWAAFLAPDLAGLFADEPWLDLPPSPDAQADLLLRLRSIKPADFLRVLDQLRPAATLPATEPGTATAHDAEADKDLRQQASQAAEDIDPRQFLLAVMRDPSAELGLRVEAAKALLPYFEGWRRD